MVTVLKKEEQKMKSGGNFGKKMTFKTTRGLIKHPLLSLSLELGTFPEAISF